MDLDLSPSLCVKAYDGDGGSYFIWNPSDQPALAVFQKGAAKLVLERRGLALPSYSDSSKIAYVLEGSGTAGIIMRETQTEKMIAITKGDVIALHFGTVAWWFNTEDIELVILFLGDTSKACKLGEFTDFHLSDIVHRFTTNVIINAWNLPDFFHDEWLAKRKTQKTHIVKLNDNIKLKKPSVKDREGIVINFNEVWYDVDIAAAGNVVVFCNKNLPLVEECGFDGHLVKLSSYAIFVKGFSVLSSVQVICIIRGSGKLEVMDVDDKKVLETSVKAGSLFVVPSLFGMSMLSGTGGMEWFSIITTPNLGLFHISGTTTIWKAVECLRESGASETSFALPK